MDLEVLGASLMAFLHLLEKSDSSATASRVGSILMRENVIIERAWLDDTWPINGARQTPDALPICVLFAAERRGPAIRPFQFFSAAIRRTDGIVGDPQFLRFSEEFVRHDHRAPPCRRDKKPMQAKRMAIPMTGDRIPSSFIPAIGANSPRETYRRVQRYCHSETTSASIPHDQSQTEIFRRAGKISRVRRASVRCG